MPEAASCSKVARPGDGAITGKEVDYDRLGDSHLVDEVTVRVDQGAFGEVRCLQMDANVPPAAAEWITFAPSRKAVEAGQRTGIQRHLRAIGMKVAPAAEPEARRSGSG
jgi:hypothetical protein